MSALLLYGFSVFFNVSITSIPVLSGVLTALCIFLFFYLQIFVSGGAWLGGGDLRIAILMGLVLGVSLGFYGVMITYIS
jgi:hypothetical protein